MFDSGIGGLTVLNALMTSLPNERFIYLGDTARVPYGPKPQAMVRGFAEEIASHLLSLTVKGIVIACNTASAASLPALAERLPVPVWGVIEPGVSAAMTSPDTAAIGVLGTVGTIGARVYQDRLEAAGRLTWSKACPLFVPIVEEGISDSDIARLVASHYLAERPELSAVILGCTHYPLLKPVLRELLGEAVDLIDSSEAVAATVAADLRRLGLERLLTNHDEGPRLRYLVTGDVGTFLDTSRRLGGHEAPAFHVDLRRQAVTNALGIEAPATELSSTAIRTLPPGLGPARSS